MDILVTIDVGVNSCLWHYILRRMSERGMKELKSIEWNFCESYIFDKQKRVWFSKVERELKLEKLEFVHTDV